MNTCINCGQPGIGDDDAFEWQLEGPLCSLICADEWDEKN